MSEYLKVRDNSNIVRDPYSGAIINLNSEDYKKRMLEINNKNEIQTMKSEINKLRDDVSELSGLLKDLIKGINND